MQIQVPAGMTYQQYVQTPAGQRDMQAMQNWFGGGASASAAPGQPAPRERQQLLPGTSASGVDFGPTGPLKFYDDGGFSIGTTRYGPTAQPPARPTQPGMPPTRPSTPRPQTTLDFNKQRRQQELDFRAAKQAMQPGRATSVATFSGGTPYSPPRRPASSRPPAGRFPTRP